MMDKYENYDEDVFDAICFAHDLLDEEEGREDIDNSQQCIA